MIKFFKVISLSMVASVVIGFLVSAIPECALINPMYLTGWFSCLVFNWIDRYYEKH